MGHRYNERTRHGDPRPTGGGTYETHRTVGHPPGVTWVIGTTSVPVMATHVPPEVGPTKPAKP